MDRTITNDRTCSNGGRTEMRTCSPQSRQTFIVASCALPTELGPTEIDTPDRRGVVHRRAPVGPTELRQRLRRPASALEIRNRAFGAKS
jgi:hypothetical protein